MSTYFPFNTNGARSSYSVPQEVHDKIGVILHEWIASKGIPIEKNSMILYVEGHCHTKDGEES